MMSGTRPYQVVGNSGRIVCYATLTAAARRAAGLATASSFKRRRRTGDPVSPDALDYVWHELRRGALLVFPDGRVALDHDASITIYRDEWIRDVEEAGLSWRFVPEPGPLSGAPEARP